MKRKFGEEALNQIQAQLEMDVADIREWNSEYVDYRSEHRQRIHELRAIRALIRENGRAVIRQPQNTPPFLDAKSNLAIARAILRVRAVESKMRKP